MLHAVRPVRRGPGGRADQSGLRRTAGLASPACARIHPFAVDGHLHHGILSYRVIEGEYFGDAG
ncbi:hypothetical protein [Amycolatopsis sulphurea]|uniref:hypothetical protein n=1 Tax=Amycolatopsis sulphurea TaxID=76022 RepID=UPI000BF628FA|nr:hypothetical protein [Amycolatopsis sulphurea]